MRRRVVIAILCTTLLVVSALAWWLGSRTDGWAKNIFHPTPVAASAPIVPESRLPDAIAPVITGESTLTADQVQKAWGDVVAVAAQQKWNPWTLIANADTGDVIFEYGTEKARTPASTLKLLTGYTALATMDPDGTLSTGVSLEGNQLYLWGEGDLLLTASSGSPDRVNGRAGVADLAAQTAEKLTAKDIRAVKLSYQNKLFDGPLRPPAWAEQEVSAYGGDQSAFAIDTGRTAPGTWQFVDSSAQIVAEEFAHQLTELGVEVNAITELEGDVPGGAVEVARVESAPILEQIRLMLVESDNTLAEQFCRLAAKQSGAAKVDLEVATSFVSTTLTAQGISVEELRLADCSGLDKDSKVTAKTLQQVLETSLESETAVKSLTRILPIGGLSGTLEGRFEEEPGFANMVGKTGSLGSVSTLAGVGRTESGTNLLIIVGADDVKDNAAYAVRPDLDRFVEAILGS